MSHEVETMAFAGETPWHGLGKRVGADLSPEQMLVEAELDWTIEKRPVSVSIKRPDGKTTSQTIKGRKALVRVPKEGLVDVEGNPIHSSVISDTLVSDGWHVLQNAEAFQFFHDYVVAGGMQMHTAGSLRGGQVVWALAKINDGFDLFGGDTVESYMMFSVNHRYGHAHDVAHTPIRVVCMNTLRWGLERAGKRVRVNHSKPFDAEKVKEKMGIAHHQLIEYKEKAAILGAKRFTDEAVREYFLQLYPQNDKQKLEEKTPAGAQTMLDVLNTQPGHEYAEGSWWQAFNAATYAIDHKIGKTADVRMDAAWFGGQATKKDKALDLALEYARLS